MRRIGKVLVANRGEIAVRVFRTLKSLGIPSVAVYHQVDSESLAVGRGDEAVEIFGATPVGAYLDVEEIVRACRQTGTDAVHPGFGFLSENAGFARRLEAEGITFIGPGVDAITAMGDKIASKRLAEGAGVNVIPGFLGEIEGAAHAVEVSRRIGYPVMLKAAGGGGGKGMRIAWDDGQCRDGFERAAHEACASFGDSRLLIEKYIERPRHIEIQLLADEHGGIVYLGERECSIQRRHQKVVEEAPSPFLGEQMRRRMGEQAVALAKAVNYRSAGTVEFIADAERNFYFLEMNTRLQVEHPVTEMVTGIDLVAEQIRIARGERLGYGQEDVRLTGNALECRIYAENADDGFTPATGRVLTCVAPVGEGVRLDSGIAEHSEVTSAFDPMLAKLVVHGSTREVAIRRARQALADMVLLGVTTNISFLGRLLAHERFVSGDLHTGFLDQHREELRRPEPTDEQTSLVLAAACLSSRVFTDPRYEAPAPLLEMGDWRN